MESRKVQKSKSGSFLVTLPKSWVGEVGLEKGDVVEMDVYGDGSLVLNPRLGSSTAETKIDLDVEKCPDIRSLVNMIKGCYMQGTEKIRIFSSDGSIIEGKNSLRAITFDLIGAEVVLNRPDEFIIQVLVDPSRFPISNLVFRISNLLSSIQQDSMEAIETGNIALASDASDRGKEINQLYWLMNRQLGISVKDRDVANSIGIKNRTEILHYAVASRDLNRMGHHFVKVAEKVGKLGEGIDLDIITSLVNISKLVSKMREKSVKAIISNDFRSANEVIAGMKKVKQLDRNIRQEILNKSMEPETSYELLFLNKNLRQATGHAVAISGVAINKIAFLQGKPKD